VADMGPCKRPGFTGEGTETLAYRKAAIRDFGQRSLPDTEVYQLRIPLPVRSKRCDGRVAHRRILTIGTRGSPKPKA